MPSAEFNTKDLMGLLDGDIGLDHLAQAIPMLGVDLESADDEKLSVEVFPNRPDMLSVEGFARALNGFLGLCVGAPKYDVCDSGFVLEVDSSVDGIRPAVVAAAAYNVRMDDYTVKSVMDIQEKLHLTHGRNRAKVAIGAHDLDKVSFPVVYEAVDPDSRSFIPLELGQELTLRKILSKHPKGRDYAWTLEGKELYPLFTDAKGHVLSFPPIINGEHTRLTPQSENVFIEMTGTDQRACKLALNIFLTALADRGAKIASVDVVRR